MISITSYRRAANRPSKDVHVKINQATPSARVTGGTHDGHADPKTWRSASATTSSFDVTARYEIWNSLCLAAAFLHSSRFASPGRVRNTNSLMVHCRCTSLNAAHNASHVFSHQIVRWTELNWCRNVQLVWVCFRNGALLETNPAFIKAFSCP